MADRRQEDGEPSPGDAMWLAGARIPPALALLPPADREGIVPIVTESDTRSRARGCGAEAGQSSDPTHMSRSVCYCGHPRDYDDVHDEGRCPCQAPTR